VGGRRRARERKGEWRRASCSGPRRPRVPSSSLQLALYRPQTCVHGRRRGVRASRAKGRQVLQKWRRVVLSFSQTTTARGIKRIAIASYTCACFSFLAIIRFLVRRLTDRPADREDAAWHGHSSRVCLAYYLDKLFTICLRISLACWRAVKRRGLIRSGTLRVRVARGPGV